jgi:hypothetical protein
LIRRRRRNPTAFENLLLLKANRLVKFNLFAGAPVHIIFSIFYIAPTNLVASDDLPNSFSAFTKYVFKLSGNH